MTFRFMEQSGPDGRVQQATVLSVGRPDIEKRAIDIVPSWLFSAPLCNGRPTIVWADLVIHFPPPPQADTNT